MAQITIETANGPRLFEGDGPIRIGRDPVCELIVDNPNVSRHHAEVRQVGGEWHLVDTNSTQGVFVDGTRVTDIALTGRTTVSLGRTDDAERLTFVVALPPRSDAATQLPVSATIVVEGDADGAAVTGVDRPVAQRPGGVLRDADVAAAGTVVTGQTLNVQCAGRNYNFEPGRTVVAGRDDDCDVVADNPTVSRRHAELRHDGTRWHLVDLGSSRGTYVDGERITDMPLAGSVAAWLGDPEAGERMVLVTSGERPPSRRPAAISAARNTKLLVAIGGIALVAVVVALVALLRGGGGVSNTRLAQATVRIIAPDYTGSGVVIDAKKGLIITNAHVGDSTAPGLAVQYPDEFLDFGKSPTELTIAVSPGLDRAAEPRYRATVQAVDGYLDLAVLKITKTAAGALISSKDLNGLIDMKIGHSEKMKTGDDIRIVGYPGINNSRNPSITNGVIASNVQDDRLSTNAAWFNATAAASPGNSGGGVVDDGNRLIAVFAQNVSSSSTGATANRGRPIDLASKLIDAAEQDRTYTSPYIKPLPAAAKLVAVAVIDPDADAGFADGCNSTAKVLSLTADGVGVQVQYAGFTPNVHQDALVTIVDTTDQTVAGMVDTNSQWPLKFQGSGCVTATVPLRSGIDSTHKYTARIFLGPAYDRGGSKDFQPGSDDNNVVPPPG